MTTLLPANDNSTTNQSLKAKLDSVKSGKPRGLQNFLHGILYQVKLSLYYAIFACEKFKRKEDFCVANEMPNGGILDDLVVVTKNPDGRKKINIFFLQAKHSLGGNAITYTDMLKDTDTSPFSIVSFFKSYKLIRADPIYSTFDLEKCYLCSNAPLNKKMQQLCVEIKDGNNFFYQESGELWKINSKSPLILELRNKLKKTTDIETLAIQLAHCIINETTIVKTCGIFSIYHVALFKEKVLAENGFHHDFIANNALSANAMEIRRKFLIKVSDILSEKEGKRILIKETKEFLKNIWLKISAKFGKVPDLLSLDSLNSENFAKELYNLIKKNSKNPGDILYNKKAVGRHGKSGRNQIDMLAQYIFVYADNRKTIKFRSSFFDNDFAASVDHLVTKRKSKKKFKFQQFGNDKEKVKTKLLEFKTHFFNLIKKKNGKVSVNILKQCRFKMNQYVTVCETELATLPRNEDTSDDEINKFFADFYFAVNQPNEEKLTELINAKLSTTYNLSDSLLASSYLLEKAMNWMKDAKSECLDGLGIDKMISDAKKKIQNLGISEQTRKYRKELLQYGNDHKVTQFKDFLKDPTKQILWLSTAEPLAIATMIPATLKETDKNFCKHDNYIMSPLSSFMHSQEETLAFFDSPTSKPLIIIDTNDKKIEADSIKIFAQNTAKIIANNTLAKLVIISKDNSLFANEFKHPKIKISFNDYNKKPSAKFIRLQDEWVKLKTLLKNGIEPELLKELMSFERIRIGKPLNGHSKNDRRATYKNGRINVIELGTNEALKATLNNKAKTMKKKYPSHWIVLVNLKNIIKKHKNILSAKKLLSCSLTKQYANPKKLNQKMFEYLYDSEQIILVIDGFTKITKNDISIVKELVNEWRKVSREIWIMRKKNPMNRQIF